MLSIDKQQNITLTRGDTLTLTVSITKDGHPYVLQEGDVVRFALSIGYVGKKGYKKIMTQTLNNSLTITIPAETTKAFTEDSYNYDIQITHNDGSVDTFISAKLKLKDEVE